MLIMTNYRFATSFSAVVTLTSEFCHNGIRDRVILCQSSCAAVAQIVIAAMSWGILTQDWRYSIFGGRLGELHLIIYVSVHNIKQSPPPRLSV